jgi:hypothetical protein
LNLLDTLLIASGPAPSSDVAAIISVWIAFWAIRHKGELDYKLDTAGKFIRWLSVGICLGFVFLAPELLNPPYVRVSVFVLGMAFLVWPNLAYHLTRVLRQVRILPRHDPKEVNNPTWPGGR